MSFSADDTTVEIVLMSGKCLNAQVSNCESQDCNSQLELDCVAALLRLAKEPVEFPQTKKHSRFQATAVFAGGP
jgi:hypothetical protein